MKWRVSQRKLYAIVMKYRRYAEGMSKMISGREAAASSRRYGGGDTLKNNQSGLSVTERIRLFGKKYLRREMRRLAEAWW